MNRSSLATLLRSVTLGSLRQKVTLQRAILIADEAGGQERTHQFIDSVWARIEPVAAEAVVIEGQAAQLVSHRIVLRWRNDIDGSCRILFRTRIFQVHAVADADEMRRYLIIHAGEVRP